MNLSGLSIRRPVAISMIVLGILLLGFVSLEKIPLNLLPDITYPKITIRTEYQHAAPREVEERVTKFIESQVGIINNVVKVSSVSRPGWSDVYVEFKWGSDIDVIALDIREKLQMLENLLADEVERPILLRYDPNQEPILTLAVGGDMGLSELRRWVEMNVELELERMDGVAAVKVEGGYEQEVMVELDEERLSRFGIRMSTVIDRIRRENVNIAGGSLEQGGTKLAVRTVNRFTDIEDIREMIVAEKGVSPDTGSSGSAMPMPAMPMGGMGGMGGGIPAGLGGLLAGLGGLGSMADAGAQAPVSRAVIRLKDLGRVEYRHKERTEIARLNGTECIKVSIYKEGDANIVTVARSVHRTLEEIREKNRAEARSMEWVRELGKTSRALKKFVNFFSNVLLSYKPFPIKEEPIILERDIQIEVISDQSVFITQAVASVAQTAIWGALIAVFVLYVFLRNISSTLIVGLAIPVSIITTFNCLFFMDISFNIMSLGGLALGVGMLVDNSIVVLENILRKRSLEPDLKISGEQGASEVSSAITASTITNIMVFLPIVFMEGMFREIFGDLAWTVVFSLICSEVVALSIVPMLSVVFGNKVRLPPELVDEMDFSVEERKIVKKILDRDGEDSRGSGSPESGPKRSTLRYGAFRELREKDLFESGQAPGVVFRIRTFVAFVWWWPLLFQVLIFKMAALAFSRLLGFVLKYPLIFFDLGFKRIKGWYPEALRTLLTRPYLVSVSAILVSVFSLLLLYFLGWELLPAVDQAEFRIRVELPTGTPIEETNRRIAGMEELIRSISRSDTIEAVFATVGISTAEGGGASEKAENIGDIHVSILDRTHRDISDVEIIAQAMASLDDEIEVSARSLKPQLLSYKAPIEIEIEGNDLEKLKEASELVMGLIRSIPGLLEVESSMAEQNPEVNITIDRVRASAFGLSVSEITEVVRLKIKGESPTRLDYNNQQLDIMVELEKKDRATLERLKRLMIPSPQGDIRLEQVALIIPGLGPASITRSENSRVALIWANIHSRPLGDVVRDINSVLENASLPAGCHWKIAGQNEEMQRSLPDLYLAIMLAVALVYIVLSAQFESVVHPFVIMFCVPFSMVGLCAILLLTGQTINIFSMIGMLMMVGIAVNDAIILVTTINHRRDEGMERLEAIVEAGRSRLRPILITTLTTALAMLPMAIALGPGSELRSPMAITVIGGLISSTLFTLSAIPCIYLVLDNIITRSYRSQPTSAVAEPAVSPLPPGAGHDPE